MRNFMLYTMVYLLFRFDWRKVPKTAFKREQSIDFAQVDTFQYGSFSKFCDSQAFIMENFGNFCKYYA